MRNHGRRKELGRVFFDLGKYLLTTIAVGGIFADDLKWGIVGIAVTAATFILVAAYFITPENEEV